MRLPPADSNPGAGVLAPFISHGTWAARFLHPPRRTPQPPEGRLSSRSVFGTGFLMGSITGSLQGPVTR